MTTKAFKTHELLERIFATQVLLFNRLNRIENSLSRADPEYFDRFEGNNYRENLADIGMSVLGIGAALSRSAPEPRTNPKAPMASRQPAPAPELDDALDAGHIIMAS